jgi:hypothetical protein
MRHVAALARDVAAVLAGGAAGPDPAAHGLTTAEERATCSAPAVAAPAQLPPHMHRMHPAALTAGGLRSLTWAPALAPTHVLTLRVQLCKRVPSCSLAWPSPLYICGVP